MVRLAPNVQFLILVGWSMIHLWLKVFILECQVINGIHILHLGGNTSHVSLAAVLLVVKIIQS